MSTALLILSLTVGDTTVSGSTDLDDNVITEYGGGGLNYGAITGDYIGLSAVGDRNRMLFRVDASAIPEETFTAITLRIKRYPQAVQSVNGGTMETDLIVAANEWVEGTKSGTAAAAGESCWNQRAVGSANWSGSSGCGTAGDDYDTSPTSETSFDAFTSGDAYDWDIDFINFADEIADIRDSVRTNNGWLIHYEGGTNASMIYYATVEHSTTPITMIFEYGGTPAGTPAHHHMMFE